jgi:crossover junction endodeoxyribonuclease RuvC
MQRVLTWSLVICWSLVIEHWSFLRHSDFVIPSDFWFRISGFCCHIPMRILGIDPGLQITGYGVIDYAQSHPKLIDGGVIRLKPGTSIADRLVELEIELESLIQEHGPQVCAVEQLYSHYAHPRTAILMGHARGVILLVARRHGVRVEEFAANRVKQSLTGHGHASKAQMQRAIQSVWNLKSVPEPADVADALAVALCAGRAEQPLSMRRR